MGEMIKNALFDLIGTLLFYIERLLCNILDLVYGMFEVFAGINTVRYGKDNFVYLTNFFFDEPVIVKVFWGMAVIGIALTFVFAIASVTRKTFDSNDKVKLSYGVILTNIFKSVLLILLMSTIVNLTLFSTNVLMQQIDTVFDLAEEDERPETIKFNDEDYATMYRILDNVATYTMNPSYDNTYNINACFNSIRNDLNILDKKKFFKYSYESPKDSDGKAITFSTWQEAIRNIGVAADIDQDLMLDQYNAAVNKAITECADLIKKDGSFKPLAEYTQKKDDTSGAALGRTVLVASTFNAANNSRFNQHASLTDDLRKQYYKGQKNIYDIDSVEEDFSLGLDKFNHIIALFGTIFLIKQFLVIMLNCIGRIFNMLILYLVAPPFIAVMPLDDGGKFKQWITAFVIQAFGIFGTFVAVRALILFVPLILNPDLILFDNETMNITGKLLIILGIAFTASRASTMISGILADNAGMQSLLAGDTGGAAAGALEAVGRKAAGMAVGAAVATGATVGKGFANATGLTHMANSVSQKAGGWVQSMKDNFGLAGAIRNGWETNASRKQSADKAKEAKQDSVFDKVLSGDLDSKGGGGGDIKIGINLGNNDAQRSANKPPLKPNHVPPPKGKPQKK